MTKFARLALLVVVNDPHDNVLAVVEFARGVVITPFGAIFTARRARQQCSSVQDAITMKILISICASRNQENRVKLPNNVAIYHRIIKLITTTTSSMSALNIESF